MSIIACKNVSVEYLPGRPVLREVNFSIEPGTFHFLSGPSGAGKTTLLNLLALCRRPACGSVVLFGQDMDDLPRRSLPAFRRRIGLVSQDYRLLSHLTVAENVALPLKVADEAESTIRERVDEMLEWVGLSGCADARPEELSGGQQQRVCIARAVIHKPDLLLADEPSGNLDLQLSLRFMYLFEALHRLGATVLLATHDDYLISQFSHPVLRLENGVVESVEKTARNVRPEPALDSAAY